MSTVTAPSVLTAEQVAQYDRDGFIVLREVFTADEIACLGAEAESLMQRKELIDKQNIRCRWSDHVETKECTFDCFDPVIDIAPVCRFFAYDERMLQPLRELYRDDAFLFKDKLIFKYPGMKGYQLHQDYIGWASFPESFVTAIVAIDSTERNNGATEVFPGYHTQGCLSTKDGDYHELPLSMIDEATGVLLELQPGDVAIFCGFTPHRSAPNLSDRPRRQLYLSYNAGRDGGEQRDAHYREFHEWLVKKYAEYGKTSVWFR
jgi:ectoine hydroxylase-related dioxygenase (phytanoyl-CoA dioxygenase family)